LRDGFYLSSAPANRFDDDPPPLRRRDIFRQQLGQTRDYPVWTEKHPHIRHRFDTATVR
jgi:hypothetical protein